jgi:hypothetical protein
VEIEPGTLGRRAPVVAFRADDALHVATIAFSSEVGTGLHSNQVYADCADLSA